MKWKQKRHLLVSLLFKKVREEWGLGALMFNLMALGVAVVRGRGV